MEFGAAYRDLRGGYIWSVFGGDDNCVKMSEIE